MSITQKVKKWFHSTENKKMKTRILVGILSVFLIFTLLLAVYFYKSWKYEQKMAEIRNQKNSMTITTQSPHNQEKHQTQGVLPQYQELLSDNNDLAGWITIKDTNVDYPVMQTTRDPEFYLHRGFQKEDNENGLPFIDAVCNVFDEKSNIIIYGHNMKSGIMFSDLLEYQQKDFYDKHSIILFDTLYEQREYQITNVFISHIPSDIPYAFVNSEDKKTVEHVLQEAEKLSLYDTGVKGSYGDDFLTLSTCDYSTEGARLVVMAKRIK